MSERKAFDLPRVTGIRALGHACGRRQEALRLGPVWRVHLGSLGPPSATTPSITLRTQIPSELRKWLRPPTANPTKSEI